MTLNNSSPGWNIYIKGYHKESAADSTVHSLTALTRAQRECFYPLEQRFGLMFAHSSIKSYNTVVFFLHFQHGKVAHLRHCNTTSFKLVKDNSLCIKPWCYPLKFILLYFFFTAVFATCTHTHTHPHTPRIKRSSHKRQLSSDSWGRWSCSGRSVIVIL